MASISDLGTEEIVVPILVWIIIVPLYYAFQSKRRPKEKMKAGEVSTDHLYYVNYFFYVSNDNELHQITPHPIIVTYDVSCSFSYSYSYWRFFL
jgi:hypothetical protein